MSNEDKTPIEKMWQYMDWCNGEIRIQAGRYGGGWIAVGCCTEEWDFDEAWSDLVCGDNDYFHARDYFENSEQVVIIEHAKTAYDAWGDCVDELVRISTKEDLKHTKQYQSLEDIVKNGPRPEPKEMSPEQAQKNIQKSLAVTSTISALVSQLKAIQRS